MASLRVCYSSSECRIVNGLALTILSILAVAPVSAQWTSVIIRPDAASESTGLCAAGNRQGGYAAINGRNHAALWSASASTWVDLHPQNAGLFVSEVLGMSTIRQVGYTYNGDVHAAMWQDSEGSWVDLNPAAAPSSAAYATDGSLIVGRVQVGVADHATVWDLNGALLDLHPGDSQSSYALAVSGRHVAGYRNVGSPLASRAMFWPDATPAFVDLNPPLARGSFAFGVSGDTQVGYVMLGSNAHASLWTGTAASWVDLNPNSSVTSQALAAFGTQQAGFTTLFDTTTHAAWWNGTAGSYVDLQSFAPPGTFSSTATGVWDDGQFTYVIGYCTINFHQQAVIWIHADPCRADFNHDGSLDFFDYLDFVDAFSSQLPVADFNHDTVIDFFDYLDFVDEFSVGC